MMMHNQPKNILFHIYFSLEVALVASVSFLLGKWLTDLFHVGMPMIGGLWVAISAIIVLQNDLKRTRHFAFVRILGSLVGAILAGVALSFLPLNFLTICLVIFLAVLCCKLLKFEEGVRLAALTAAVIIAVGYTDPHISYSLNAIERFVQSLVGAVFALLVRLVFMQMIKWSHVDLSKFSGN